MKPPIQRITDIPGPRRGTSIMGPLVARVFASPYRFVVAGIYRAGIKPWQLTVLSLAGNATVGWLLISERRLLPGLLLIPAGLMDTFDGAIARLRGEAGRAGAFLDSVMDRISDLIVFSCLFWSLAGQRQTVGAALSLAALIVSLLVSHVRAEAEAMNVSMTEGVFQRLERYVALIVGLLVPGALVPVLGALTLLGGVTVVQRVAAAWGKLDRPL